MKIGELLKKDRINLNLQARDKEGVIRELASLFQDIPEMVDLQGFINDVFERERLNPTGIGNGVAIPHARTDNVKDFVIAFGRSTEGIDFEAMDGKPVNLFFLMGTPKEKGLNAYLKILARLTRLLQKESFRAELLQASTPEEIIEVFLKAEQ